MDESGFQGFSLADKVLALACELSDVFCVAADLAAEFLPLRGDATAGRMSAF